MNESEDEIKREIPALYRASLDESDAEAFARLQENDRAQRELKEKINTPFTAHSPKEREMANAFITIDALENVQTNYGLMDAQRDQLAEAYAATGQFNRAAQITSEREMMEMYESYWEAVWLDDDDWCEHPDKHKYIKDTVFSVRESQFRPLLACNICQTINAADAPENLRAAQKRRADVREQTKGMDKDQVKSFLETSGLKNRQA